jgi:6-phosphogluconolactonase
MTRLAFLSLFASLMFGIASAAEPAKTLWVYFGTYGKGIYRAELDTASGKLTSRGLAGETANPSFLAIHPSQKFLFAVGEIGNFKGKPGGVVNAFAIEPKTGKLTLLNQQSSKGSGPCHVSVDKTGKNVLVANYGGGSVAVLPIGDDGKLAEASAFVQHTGTGPNKARQEGPHAHSINLDPGNRFAVAADLGLDKVMIYRFDPAKGSLTPNDPAFGAAPPGAGPRHFSFHPSGKYGYVCDEMTSQVTAFSYDADKGVLKEIQTISTLPEPVKGNSTAEVVVHPSGKFVYCSNRGHNSIAIFSIDADTGKLTRIGNESTQGKIPRNFALDPSGSLLLAANQDSNNVVVFKVDPATGKLTATGSQIEVPKPVCVRMMPPVE